MMRKRIDCLAFLSPLFILLLLGSTSHGQNKKSELPKIAGPLVGHATSTSVTLWMYAPKAAKLEAKVRSSQTEGAEASKEASAAFSPIADPAGKVPGAIYTVTFKYLKPATHYNFSVAIDGKVNPKRVGRFRTAPPQGEPAKFRMTLTSCMKAGQPAASWYLMLAQRPDLHLTVGDTHYADTTKPTTQWQHHLRYRQQPYFATVLRSMPNYAIWDDHDYGPNNSDGTAKGKENSLKGWQQIWGNPASGTSKTPGAFFKFTWGDVDFFVVDGRYHRSPDNDKDDDKKRMLGDAQFEWLIKGLASSKAKFKVIASGSTLNHSSSDGWRIYSFSRKRLFNAIRENKIPGVVYMSGDIHRSLVWEHHESKQVGYPLVEVISSGIANSKTLSFASIDFDTTLSDPTMRVRIIHGDGTVQNDKTWSLSQLQVK